MTDLSTTRLLIVDTAGIQDYIFNSNRLRENVGASYLVAAVTGEWALATVREIVAEAHNIDPDGNLIDRRIEDDSNLRVEVIYAGGGNFAALFRDEPTAFNFTRALSKKVLELAPGLRVFIQHEPYEWGSPLGEAITSLLHGMRLRRGTAANVAPLAGLGVTVMCDSTALPAVGHFAVGDDAPRAISAEVAAKNQMATPNGGQPSAADTRLQESLFMDERYAYPVDFDDLGRTRGDSSFIAVVHADGDGVGNYIQGFAKEGDPRTYILKMRQFSQNLQAASQKALRGTIAGVVSRIKWDSERKTYGISHPDPKITLRFELVERDGVTYLPIRPIVFGGDDVAFVCDARLGLALTVDYARRFQEETKALGFGENGSGLSACAGVAMVKTRYPFARAYALADDLCGEAKKYREQKQIAGGCLHWHFALGGVYGDWDTIREREYTAQTGDSLTLRPVALNGEGYASWEFIERQIALFQTGDWLERRNKAKALRDALRAGAEAEQWFYRQYEIKPPNKFGWQNNVCIHFDALELMDMMIPLEAKS